MTQAAFNFPLSRPSLPTTIGGGNGLDFKFHWPAPTTRIEYFLFWLVMHFGSLEAHMLKRDFEIFSRLKFFLVIMFGGHIAFAMAYDGTEKIKKPETRFSITHKFINISTMVPDKTYHSGPIEIRGYTFYLVLRKRSNKSSAPSLSSDSLICGLACSNFYLPCDDHLLVDAHFKAIMTSGERRHLAHRKIMFQFPRNARGKIMPLSKEPYVGIVEDDALTVIAS